MQKSNYLIAIIFYKEFSVDNFFLCADLKNYTLKILYCGIKKNNFSGVNIGFVSIGFNSIIINHEIGRVTASVLKSIVDENQRHFYWRVKSIYFVIPYYFK